MSAAKELRQRIEGCELQHPAFVELFEILNQRIEGARDGFAARIEWVTGPSRVGKTMLINALLRGHLEEKIRANGMCRCWSYRFHPTFRPSCCPSVSCSRLVYP